MICEDGHGPWDDYTTFADTGKGNRIHRCRKCGMRRTTDFISRVPDRRSIDCVKFIVHMNKDTGEIGNIQTLSLKDCSYAREIHEVVAIHLWPLGRCTLELNDDPIRVEVLDKSVREFGIVIDEFIPHVLLEDIPYTMEIIKE